MGGGDLNLKKSWHPQTIRNVEKVWKAEQKAEAEAKKIDQLRREIQDERAREDMQRHAVEQGIARKRNEKLDWMYSAPGQVDREEYLLGKLIDKKVDPLAKDEEEEAEAPGASFMNDTGANSVADLAAKVRDDPLFMIKRKEDEKRKELMHNPVKMKQLRQMLQANLEKSKKKEKKQKKEKKKKKEKKRKREKTKQRSVSESGSDSADERSDARVKGKEVHNGSHRDEFLRSASRSPVRRKRRSNSRSPKRKHSKRSRSPVKKDSDRLEERHRHRQRYSPLESGTGGRGRQSRRSRSRSPIKKDSEKRKERKQKRNSPRLNSGADNQRKRTRQRSKSPVKKSSRDREKRKERQNSSTSPEPKSDGRSRKGARSRSPVQTTMTRSLSKSPPRKSRRSPLPTRDRTWKKGSAVSKKLDAAELEKRRAAMMENAKWRDEQRGKNIERHQEEESREKAEEARNLGKEAKFIDRMKTQSFSSKATASVADRIKRNINSIQRTPAALGSFLEK